MKLTGRLNIWLIVFFSLVCCSVTRAVAVRIQGIAPEPLFENSDFESGTLQNWTKSGNAFDCHPTRGDNSALRDKPAVPHGNFWIGTFEHYNGQQGQPGQVQGDDKTGTLQSIDFIVKKRFINFLIGGGSTPSACTVEIWVENQLFYSATGKNTEKMELCSVDVSSVMDRFACVIIRDEAVGSWGHIDADWFTASDRALSGTVAVSKELKVNGKYLLVPVRSDTGARETGEIIRLEKEGALLREFRVEFPENGRSADWTAAYPVDELLEETVTLTSRNGTLPAKYMDAMDQITVGDVIPDRDSDYALPYRDQFHFSPRRGWNNDVNGLVYNNGTYHLYYQYNPFNIGWDNMHWGHASSTDLIRWAEHDIVLFQNSMDDMMYSGGGFLYPRDSAGVASSGVIPQYAAFTSTGRGECLAYSLDGGFSFTELPENPVLKHNGRDPKIIWHEPTQQWIMAVFEITDEIMDPPPIDSIPDRRRRDSIAFYSSKNLKEWTFESRFIHPDRNAIHECPELFEVAVEGRPEETRWILYGVENRYFIGQFNGHEFVMESGPFSGETGVARAAQMVSDAPDGRKIQIAWARGGVYRNRWPNQRFSQGFMLPKEVALHETPDGLRLYFYPVKEVDSLRGRQLGSLASPSVEDADKLLKSGEGKLLDVLVEYELGDAAEMEFAVNGQSVSVKESGSLRILSDRTITEAFVNEGKQAFGFRRGDKNFDDVNCGITLSGKGNITNLTVFEMKSMWNNSP
ncbi:MAG: glycoside hydrolase family 32 protein [Kiritimatiellales bacterium]